MGIKSLARDFKLRHTLRQSNTDEYSYSGNLRAPGKIMVLLPNRANTDAEFYEILAQMNELYKNAEFTFVGGLQANLPRIQKYNSYNTIKPTEDDLSWSGLPNKNFVSKIKMYQSELLIDLSVKKDYFNAFIAAVSQVPIRIGNFGSWGPPVYNFEIKSNHVQNEQLIHKSFMDVLKSISAGTAN